jgi:hypothetical protein
MTTSYHAAVSHVQSGRDIRGGDLGLHASKYSNAAKSSEQTLKLDWPFQQRGRRHRLSTDGEAYFATVNCFHVAYKVAEERISASTPSKTVCFQIFD